MAHVEIKNLYKIFGPNPKKGLELSKQGMSKDEILEKTGNTIGVKDASMAIEKGETFVVMGLSGSGKSTLIRCLNRLIEPSFGEVYVDDEEITKVDQEKLREIRRTKMGMVFQNFGLFPHRTVCANVEYGLEVQGVDPEKRREKAYEALELVGLKGYEESKPSQLSGGMQQRVGLARALATDPEILLMDEAFSALDPLIRKDMQDELLMLQEKMQKTIIFITHDLDEALKIGDRIAVMKDGEVVQIGTPEGILTEPANDYVRDFVENVDRSKVIKAESIMRKADAVVDTKDGPKSAVRKMKNENISSIFVVDKARKLKGIVDIEDAMKLSDKGEKSIESIIHANYPTAGPDELIIDLLPRATDAKYPIAVVDEDNRFLGIIVRVAVISGIMGEGGNNDV
ncbi:quaternary amine ABC transporter ATP-binding protein [Isachenkonia alkalipeptolytica]|uniref:Quaternary amine transport ATP-binding protein n=1 Tax=Isachenkonia alkalipeptolytica TaxID=2565777 RepID=A0AA43XN22_9CLOT|nr:glycine betaine/L-proline ABC transporter ATP-binding protein [Isachenkonia alkalipeptolytica]NBG89299.1 glycine betaine/L-proline ABC transporter ATP-binding protein [Isachenkonia alkalipeptolytica]